LKSLCRQLSVSFPNPGPSPLQHPSLSVFGASGISGTATLKALLSTSTSQYKSILAVSRRPPSVEDPEHRIRHVNVDLTGSVDGIAEGLREAGAGEAKHVFFYSYIAKEEEEDLVETNKRLFGNVRCIRLLRLSGCPLTNYTVLGSPGPRGHKARGSPTSDRLQVYVNCT
jgi:hypothetical protein